MRTVQACDRVVLLERGQIAAEGPFTELLKTSEKFQELYHRVSDSTIDRTPSSPGSSLPDLRPD
jgi:ABC-type multidrug transport system ATPase subunit